MRKEGQTTRDLFQKHIYQLQQGSSGPQSSYGLNDGVAAVSNSEHATALQPQQQHASERGAFEIDLTEVIDLAGEGRGPDEHIVSNVQHQPAVLTMSPFTGSASAMVGSVTDDDNVRGLFGSSSAGSFMSLVRRAVDSQFGSLRPRAEASETLLAETPNHEHYENNQAKVNDPAFLLPPRRKADALMEYYWRTVFPLYPLVDPNDFQTRYDNLWKGTLPEHDESEFLCLVNTVFALSTQIDESVRPQDRSRVSKTYLKRAQALLNIWRPGSLQTVQIFLILAHYLQTTNELHQCWMSIGNAVRTAQSLGLHLDRTPNRILSSSERELRRRVWYGCVLMDRFLAMTYGRPPSISHNVARGPLRPSPISISLPILGIQPAISNGNILDFFIYSIDLFEILNDILQSLYGPRSRPQTPAKGEPRESLGRDSTALDVGPVLNIDQKLTKWEEMLPKHLQYNSKLPEVPKPEWSLGQRIHFRQSVILRQRFLHVKLLCLRPILAQFVLIELDDSEWLSSTCSLAPRLTFQCALVCVQVAQEAIAVVHRNCSLSQEVTGATATWWYNVFYIYSAATILIAARLRTSIMLQISPKSISSSWRLAIEILEKYSCFSESIPKLIATLHVLSNEVPFRYNNYSQHASQHASRRASQHADKVSFEHGSILQFSDEARLVRLASLQPAPQAVLDSPSMQTGFAQVDLLESTLRDMLYGSSDAVDFDPSDLSWLNTVPFEFE
jgi:hypothetical protein